MEARPEPGAELHRGTPTVPRLAATVILLRGDDDGLEVLLARRNPGARFMGDAWVFPGGSVTPQDGEGEAALKAAAVRELAEEAGITLAGPHELIAFSRWVTPEEVRTRFDTWFFLARWPDGAQPVVDGEEMVEARAYRPQDALAAGEAGDILLVFPTIKHLEQLAAFATGRELLHHARTRTVEPVHPRVVGSGEQARILLPGEPGYAS